MNGDGDEYNLDTSIKDSALWLIIYLGIICTYELIETETKSCDIIDAVIEYG